HFKPFPFAPEMLSNKLLHSNSNLPHFYVIIRHMQRHWQSGDKQLKWLFDLLLLSSGMNPDSFFEWIKEIHDEPLNSQTTDLVNLIFAFHSTSAIRQEIKDWINQVHQCTLKDDMYSHVSPLHVLKSPREKILWLIATVFPSPSYLRFNTPRKANHPLLILLISRWLKLAQKIYRLVLGKLTRY
ncbi:MAG: hypothetical protein J7L96_01635, partial [Bacteroidales bacterium]|nr:hypothetical protein [Bacteroidales bacterium]